MGDGAGVTDGDAAVVRAPHVPGRPVVLPNAWDAAGARLGVVAATGPAYRATSSSTTRTGTRRRSSPPAAVSG